MKIVGKRQMQQTESAARAWQDSVSRMLQGRGACRRGVFRFKTFEEAQTWMVREVANSALAFRQTPTSRD